MPKKNQKQFVNMENVRLDSQRRIMEKIRDEKVCPFCPQNLIRFHLKPIIKTGRHWLLTPNQWPYDNTRAHLMLISKRHAEKLSDISSGAWQELGRLASWAEAEYKILGGGLGLRFGDPKHNSSSVRHLHAHIISPKISNKNHPRYSPVHFKLG